LIFKLSTWCKSVVFIFFGLFTIGTIIVTVIIDPYGELNIFRTDFNKKKYASSYTTGPFLLSEKLKYDRYSLVFGTSRTQLINSSMIDGKILNFSTSLYANPSDVYHVLKQLNERQLSNIDTIYYLVDTHVFTDKKSLYENLDLHSKRDFFKQVFMSLDSMKIRNAVNCVNNNIKGYDYYINEFGENIHDTHRIFDPNSKIEHFRIPAFTKKSIAYLKMIDTLCKSKKLKIKYFTPVYNIWYLKKVDMELYRLQYKAFLTAIDQIYDFHLLNSISYDYHYFTNVDHANTEANRIIMKLLLSEEKSVIINNKNIDYRFESIIRKIKMYDKL